MVCDESNPLRPLPRIHIPKFELEPEFEIQTPHFSLVITPIARTYMLRMPHTATKKQIRFAHPSYFRWMHIMIFLLELKQGSRLLELGNREWQPYLREASHLVPFYPLTLTPDAVLRPPRLIVVLSLDQLHFEIRASGGLQGEMLAGTKGSCCVG